MVRLIDTETGEAVEFPDEIITVDDVGVTPDPFIWEEGNYACDCNRSAFFNRARGLLGQAHAPCGVDRFLVEWIKDGWGRIVYSEAIVA